MLTDTEMIEAARCGDTEAVERLLLRYQPIVAGFARRYCATPADIEDAVQETLWVAAQKIGTLRVAAAFGSWMFQVIRNECYRLLRLKRREIEFAEMPDLADPQSEAHIHLRHDIAGALVALPDTYRAVIVMCEVEEYTAPEAAAALNLSVAAVKARLHRARKMLRQSLAHWQVA